MDMYEDHCGMVTQAAQEFGAHGDWLILEASEEQRGSL